jgi:hypothetical protein
VFPAKIPTVKQTTVEKFQPVTTAVGKQPKYAAPQRNTLTEEAPPWETVTKATPQEVRPSNQSISDAIEGLKAMVAMFVNNPENTPAFKKADAVLKAMS